MRLGVRVGAGCAQLHDRLMRDLNSPLLECDEIWGYVGKKQRQTRPGETDRDAAGAAPALHGNRRRVVLV